MLPRCFPESEERFAFLARPELGEKSLTHRPAPALTTA